MLFNRDIEVRVPPDEVWIFLWDIERLADCVPGLYDVRVEEPQESYRARLKQKVGQFGVDFDVGVKVVEVDEPKFVKIQGRGRDQKMGAHLIGDLGLRLEPSDDGATTIHINADFSVLGRLAGLGHSTIVRKGEEMVREFAEAMRIELEAT
jgi:carbon monoxide dehydrogenase subunit G